MNNPNQAELLRYAADARQKLADLPKRLEAEQALAAEEERKPFAVTPLTEVDPAVLAPVLESLQDVPPELTETVGTLRKVCKRQSVPFAMRSDQLAALLELQSGKAQKPEQPQPANGE
jgi:hypothetical protein